MTAIKIDGIEKSFGPTRAVGPLSLTIEPGELVALLGPSGCGKTTTLRMIAGFEEPSAGRITIAGRDVTDMPVERRGVAMVFQTYALFPHLSVDDNVGFGLKLRGIGATECRARVAEALDLVGLADLGPRMPRQLSGGQQQRVALARALVVRPSVLLLDEPLSNLDLKLREQMRDEIRALQKKLGITAVYVTHDQGEAMAIADRIAVMNRGCIEQLDQPRWIYERPASLFVAGFIGQCSVISGRYDGLHDGYVRFVSGAGITFATTPPSAGSTWQSGRSVYLALRPEAVDLSDHGTMVNRFEATVVGTVYLGDRARLTLRLNTGGDTIVAQASIRRGGDLPAAGARLTITIDPTDCVLVDDRS